MKVALRVTSNPHHYIIQTVIIQQYSEVITTEGDGTWTLETEWGRRWLARWHRMTPSWRALCRSSGSFIFTIVSTICQHDTNISGITDIAHTKHNMIQYIFCPEVVQNKQNHITGVSRSVLQIFHIMDSWLEHLCCLICKYKCDDYIFGEIKTYIYIYLKRRSAKRLILYHENRTILRVSH